MKTEEQTYDKEEYIFMASLAHQSERYDEMRKFVNKITKYKTELNISERNLLSLAYRNVISGKRHSWREINTVLQNEEDELLIPLKKKRDGVIKKLREYKEKIEKEIIDICQEVLETISNDILPFTKNLESKIFFLKMYLAEIYVENERKEYSKLAQESYTKATELAEAELLPTNPLRLGLALNFSIFYIEIMNSPEKSFEITKKAFDTAVSHLDDLPDEYSKDTPVLLQTLRDNLTLWNSRVEND